MGKEVESQASERLLSSAGPIFAASGFEGATVREICRAADVNIASVGYYFGDKQGLYLAVIERIRSDKTRRFPIPDASTQTDPVQGLFSFVHALLSRMLEDGEEGWQVRLLMREMEHPTEALGTIVHDHFEPVFAQLCAILSRLLPSPVSEMQLKQFALSVIGQCLHYRVSGKAIRRLLGDTPALDIENLAIHITSVTLAAARGDFTHHAAELKARCQSESTSKN